MQGDNSPTEPGGIMEVAMWLCISLLHGFDLAWGLVPSSIGSRLGNEGRDPHPRPSYMGPRDEVKEASSFDIKYSSNIQLKLYFLKHVCSPKENLYIFIYSILHQPHSHKYAYLAYTIGLRVTFHVGRLLTRF